jgi:cation diffusion facilitator family transporter
LSISIASKQNFRIQKLVVLVSLVLFVIKVFAWYITHSVAILTDALESIVNVIASFIGLYSIYLSGKPKDLEHPYGHGKVEFISAAIEGVLIFVAGIFIIREAVLNLYHPNEIHKLDYGIYLIVGTAAINFLVGFICVKTGKKNNSLALLASGKHLISDTYTTVGIVVSLVLLFLTKIPWIDSIVAMVFALVILITGIKIIRSSVAGMMDEADQEMLEKMIDFLNKNREKNWIDLHNLRVIKYGSMMHVDCHLTIPWYLNVHEAHAEVEKLSGLVKQHFGSSVELFVHSDGCMDFSCSICTKTDCDKRLSVFQKKIEWGIDNVLSDKKHQL